MSLPGQSSAFLRRVPQWVRAVSQYQAAGPVCEGTAWLFPGLGSRHVGMGADIIGQHRAADRLIQEASTRLGYDVAELCLEGSGRKWVPERREVQLIYVVGCAYAAVLDDMGASPAAVCGHSMGSWSAAQVAGVYDFRTGLELLSRFDDLMQELVDPLGHGMGVVIGLTKSQVKDLCRQYPNVYLANSNSNRQYVVAGDESSVEQVLEAAIEEGASKIKRLPTTRAMHTPLMREFVRRATQILEDFPFRQPQIPMVSGNDGTWVTTRSQVRCYLASFLGLPVHWGAAVRTLVDSGVQDSIEVGAGTILTGLMRYVDRSLPVQTASDLVCEALSR